MSLDNNSPTAASQIPNLALPAKPSSSAKPSTSNSANQSLSYSAQIAQQFSSYQQTPGQERGGVRPNTKPIPNGTQVIPTTIDTTGDTVYGKKPSEMHDYGYVNTLMTLRWHALDMDMFFFLRSDFHTPCLHTTDFFSRLRMLCQYDTLRPPLDIVSPLYALLRSQYATLRPLRYALNSRRSRYRFIPTIANSSSEDSAGTQQMVPCPPISCLHTESLIIHLFLPI